MSLEENGVNHFAVAKAREALSLRENNIKGMILNLGVFSPLEANSLVRNDISQVVFSESVDILAQEARKRNKQAKVHIEIDTGTGGFGIPVDKAPAFIQQLASMPEIKIEGVMTVLMREHQLAARQVKTFIAICDAAQSKGISLGYRHAAASAELVDSPATYLDMVRTGNCLLGLEPLPPMVLKPVLSLKSRVLLTKKIPAGREIGWNNEIKIEKDTLFAAVPVGYYDGYPPNVAGKADILVRGRRYPVSGFISADHTTIDITGSRDIKIGDEVVLVGKQGNEEITNKELGRISGRGVYGQAEHLGPQLPRLIKSPGDRYSTASSADFPAISTASPFPADHFTLWLELDMENLAWNVKETGKRIGQRPILAVVKCNAYGHGLVEISKGLVKNGIHHFAVVKAREALSLRENNINGMILNLGSFSSLEAVDLVKHDISQSVFSETVNILADEARKQNKPARVHIKIDTGLGRVGVPLEEAPDFIKKVASMPEIKIEGVFTVLTGNEKIPGQLKHFAGICDAVEKQCISLGFRHAAASGDVAEAPAQAYLDMVRPGNCLYGLAPLANMNLKPVLSLKSRVVLTKRIPAGAKFGRYDCCKVEKDTLLAYVPVGSADGYPSHQPGKGGVLIKGRYFPLKGFVSSYYTTVDITGSDDIETGDEVVLIGKQGNREITNAELAEHSNQSVYQTPVYLNPNIPRLIKS
jgi:alanine racemase